MNINAKVKKTIYLSLLIQFITTVVSLDGLNYELNEYDNVLKEILILEAIVQFVEGFFYVWVIVALKDLKIMTPRRYIDWTITTPIMLFSTIIFFKYNELKENGQMTNFTTYEFFRDNKENAIKIFIYNGLMLLCGFLGEIGVIDKRIGIPLGFAFFYKSFETIYTEYAVKTELGKQLFNILAGLWSLYGISAMLPLQQKNIAYNMLDIVAKNFYGLYIYYKIKQLQIKD